MRLTALSILFPFALTACGPGLIGHQTAGAALDSGNFGMATQSNAAVHSGDAVYRVDLARRFDTDVPSTVNFAFNSTALDAEARAALRAQAAWIRQFPEIRFRVYGHTDLVGGRAYNQRLGQRRAEAVVLYLISQGISRDRLEAVVSRGDTQPLIVTEGRERRNRRTVTEVFGFVETHPMVLNGKYAQIIMRDYVASAVPPARTYGGEISGSISGSE